MPEAAVLKTLTFSGFEIKDEEKGEVSAKIGTLEVVDKDGDIIRKGALPKGARAAMSRWGHDAVFGERPVGKGSLVEHGDRLAYAGKVFLNTIEGRETFAVLKEMGTDQEWSFGFRVTGWEEPDETERKSGAYRIITKMAPISSSMFEVSPVLAGAGIGTQTTSVKAQTPAPLPQADGIGEPAVSVSLPDGEVTELKALAEKIATEVAARIEAERKAAKDAADADAQAAAAAEAARVAEAEAAERARITDLATKEFERFQRTMRRQVA